MDLKDILEQVGEPIFATPVDSVKLTDNDRERDEDGGRIGLVADSTDKRMLKEDLREATLMLNYAEDEPMEIWPFKRGERAEARFTIVVFRSKE